MTHTYEHQNNFIIYYVQPVANLDIYILVCKDHEEAGVLLKRKRACLDVFAINIIVVH